MTIFHKGSNSIFDGARESKTSAGLKYSFPGLHSWALVLAGALALASNSQANPGWYQATDLNATLEGYLGVGRGFITNDGIIVGSGNSGLTKWNGNIATVLDTFSQPSAINSAGEILARDNSGRLAVWNGTAAKLLSVPPAPGGYTNDFSFGLNRSGAVVGTIYVAGTLYGPGIDPCCEPHAAILDGTEVTNLGNSRYGIQATAINDAGVVVGVRDSANAGAGRRGDQAWVWDGNSRADLINLSNTPGGEGGGGP